MRGKVPVALLLVSDSDTILVHAALTIRPDTLITVMASCRREAQQA
jgi:hypothetical protein